MLSGIHVFYSSFVWMVLRLIIGDKAGYASSFSIIERLASALNQPGEAPNQALARALIESQDREGNRELVENLWNAVIHRRREGATQAQAARLKRVLKRAGLR